MKKGIKKILRIIKKLFFLWIILGILCVLFVFLINAYIRNSSVKYIVSSESELLSWKYVTMILGAKVRSDWSLSYMLHDRTNTAIEIYKNEKTKKLLVSWDNWKKRYDELRPTRDYLIEHGVSSGDIFLDFAGFDTYDSMYRAKHIFWITGLIISTQCFHQSRAVYIARSLDIDAYWVCADKRKYYGMRYNYFRETLATVKARFDVMFDAEPYFDWDYVSITGESNAFWYDQE